MEYHSDSIDVVINVKIQMLPERGSHVMEARDSLLIWFLQRVWITHDLQYPKRKHV